MIEFLIFYFFLQDIHVFWINDIEKHFPLKKNYRHIISLLCYNHKFHKMELLLFFLKYALSLAAYSLF